MIFFGVLFSHFAGESGMTRKKNNYRAVVYSHRANILTEIPFRTNMYRILLRCKVSEEIKMKGSLK